jgi:maleylpyruvate isomerase
MVWEIGFATLAEAQHRWEDPRMPPTDPEASTRSTLLLSDLVVLRAATARLTETVSALDDDAVASPSLLPGWTRAHLLTHVARNADGMVRLVGWARDGVERPMYPSAEARAADIEAGAGRSATAVHDDVATSAARLDDALVELAQCPADELAGAWDRRVVLGAPRPGGPELSGSGLVRARRREVEIHHADLGAGYGPADWLVAVADEILRDVAAMRVTAGGLAGVGVLRSPRETVLLDPRGAGMGLTGPAHDLAWWAAGRAAPTSLATDDGTPVPGPAPW